MKKLTKAYRRLNVQKYKRIIKNTLVPYFDDYDDEFITMLTPETVFTVQGHYCDGKFYGYNVYADGVLLETKTTRKKAEKFIRKLAD